MRSRSRPRKWRLPPRGARHCPRPASRKRAHVLSTAFNLLVSRACPCGRRSMAHDIEYSDKYCDDDFEYRCGVRTKRRRRGAAERTRSYHGSSAPARAPRAPPTMRSHALTCICARARWPATRLDTATIQARDPAQARGQAGAQRQTSLGERVAWAWRAAEPRLGPLLHPQVRTPTSLRPGRPHAALCRRSCG